MKPVKEGGRATKAKQVQAVEVERARNGLPPSLKDTQERADVKTQVAYYDDVLDY